MNYIVTGCAGFIGFHLTWRLLKDGHTVIGIDNVNDYYAQSLKHDRLALLMDHKQFLFCKVDITSLYSLRSVFDGDPVWSWAWRNDFVMPEKIDRVVHLAAQAGVRYSVENPQAYIDANVTGFQNVLDCCRRAGIQEIFYASSSSVYGNHLAGGELKECDRTDNPMSMYAATKKMNELQADVYSHMHGIRLTGMRFFTVYGPWGRPDMAIWSFTRAILDGKEIQLYRNGEQSRDFTFITDVVESVVALMESQDEHGHRHRIFNIGNGTPIRLRQFIDALEQATGMQAKTVPVPAQPGDVTNTHARTLKLEMQTGFRPRTGIQDGVKKFVEWFIEYHRHSSATR